jgi:hypothetical protein
MTEGRTDATLFRKLYLVPNDLLPLYAPEFG